MFKFGKITRRKYNEIRWLGNTTAVGPRCKREYVEAVGTECSVVNARKGNSVRRETAARSL
jgi:hypothetical protein